MVNKKPAKQINEQKWRRLNIIREKLREKPLTSKEITQLIFKNSANRTNLRTIQNYLAELIGLELVCYDSASGLYSSNERKIALLSKHDYDIALKHSERLVLTNREKQRLDCMMPFSALQMLVFWDEEETKHDPDYGRFHEHLKTGYPELFLQMENYKQEVKRLGLSSRYDVPVLRLPSTHHELDNIEDREKKKLERMRSLLVGEIYSLVDRVKHGVPLEGSCDACPGCYLSVKQRS
jgi:predicted transcriptional regulator